MNHFVQPSMIQSMPLQQIYFELRKANSRFHSTVDLSTPKMHVLSSLMVSGYPSYRGVKIISRTDNIFRIQATGRTRHSPDF
jgi:hypothetical protein